MSSRLETLKSLVAQDPANARVRYMLAIETLNSGDLEGALHAFEEVLAVDADYAAACYHGGQTLEKLGRVEQARAMYRRGVEITTRTGDEHTRSELQQAIDLLG